MRRMMTLLALACAAAIAQDAPLIPRKLLFGNPVKVSPQISPDGRMLAYIAPVEGVRNVWVRTLGKNDDRPITEDKKRGIFRYMWRGDSQDIFYLQDEAGKENYHVYMAEVAQRQIKDLTPHGDVQARIVSANPNYPDQLLVAVNNRDKRLHDVYRVDLKTGEMAMDTRNPGDVAGFNADNAMQVRAAEVMAPGGAQEIRLRQDEKSEWKLFQRWGPDETLGGVAGFSPDNKAIWLGSSVGANATRFVEVDIATGKEKVIAEDPQYDVGGWLIHPAKRTLQAVSFVRSKVEWQLLDKSVEADFAVLRKVRPGDVNVASRDLQDQKWVVSYSADASPAVYYLYDRRTKKAEFLFSSRPDLEKYKLAKMEPVSFTARDGMKLHGYLTMPVGKKKAPLVMLVHGGPWGRDVWGFQSLPQMLANRGYGVLQVNFRGSAGYGKDYLNAGDREWGAKMHTDIVDGKAWAAKNGHTDSDKVAIMGGSYGGYATLVGLAFTPDEFACGVDIVGPSNIVTLMKTIPPYWQPVKALFAKRVGNLEKEEDFLRSRSPLFKAGQIKKPLLIGQGANDPRVKQAESDQIVKAMRDNGKEVTYIVFPDEGHGFARPQNNLRFMAATDQFLAKCLGGRAEPPAEDEKWDAFLQ